MKAGMLMHRLFPGIKHVNLSNLATSFTVVLALYCQVLAVNGEIRAAITLFLLVTVLNEADGALALRAGQVTAFKNELGGLAEFINFIVTPIVISYHMGFNGLYALLFFALFFLAAIWMLSDPGTTSAVQEGGENRVRGLRCTHTGAIFAIAASASIKFFSMGSSSVFAPFFAITAMLMISSFSYGRNGKLALSLYLLTSASVILMWL